MEGRSAILTSTKGLQNQLVGDFNKIGVVEIKGRKSYSCVRGDGPTADHGLCHFGVTCSLRENGCEYYDAVRRAKHSRIVVTNYAYWMTAGAQLGEFDRVLMDEGHEAPRHLSDHLTVEIELGGMAKALGRDIVPPRADCNSWGNWARAYLSSTDLLLEEMTKKLKHNPSQIWLIRKLFRYKMRLEKMESYSTGYMVMEKMKGGFRIDPVHVSPYANILWQGVPFILLTSATATAKTASILGVDPTVVEYRSDFPISQRPTHIVPTAGISHRMTASDESKWLRTIDQVIMNRMDRKGIIHTVSYDRAQKILRSSKNRAIMRTNSSSTLSLTVSQFKRDNPPSILLSPVVTTGWDFPYSQCEYQVISKVAFPDGRSEIMKARSSVDPEYPMHIALQNLVQACGRGMRAADDRCETLIIDDNFRWLIGRYGHLAPEWFKESINWGRTIPAPPPKLRRV
jgi:Rad3-related DNA helicase